MTGCAACPKDAVSPVPPRYRAIIVIDVPQDVQVNAQVVRKAATDRVIERNAAIQLCYVEVEEPDMHKPLGDLDRLKAVLEKDWGWKDLLIAPHLIPQVQGILRKGNWGVTAAIHRDMDSSRPFIIGLYPGLKNEAYGIACDIGSTTIAMHLVSLLSGRIVASSGTSNPQIRFGEDLMSRVSYVMINPDGREAMTKAVREAVNKLIGKVCEEGNVDRHDTLRLRLRRKSDHASPVPGYRSDRTRPGAVRACRLWTAAVLGARDRHRGRPRRAPLYPALHCRPCWRRCGWRHAIGRPLPAGQNDAARRCRHQRRDRARQQHPSGRCFLAHWPRL